MKHADQLRHSGSNGVLAAFIGYSLKVKLFPGADTAGAQSGFIGCHRWVNREKQSTANVARRSTATVRGVLYAQKTDKRKSIMRTICAVAMY